MMESPLTSNVEEAKNAILHDGFFSGLDNALGDRVLKMDRDGTLLASEAGLRFFKDNVLDNPVSVPSKCTGNKVVWTNASAHRPRPWILL